MCGIAGFMGPRNPTLLRTMCETLYHRGPDDKGFYEDDTVSLSMRRLAIIDLASGQQPISNETNDVWVVFNGEIYNFEPLRDALLACGHKFRTRSDTETIVHAYEEYGLDFVQHLRGMFAIAIWDTAKKRLILVRDRIGEKPLYYADTTHGLCFGSEIKAVLKALNNRSVRAQSVCDFLTQSYVAGDATFYGEVKKLQPGEILVINGSNRQLTRYWQPRPGKNRTTVSFANACDELDELLNDAVRLCLKSDVEVAAFLSGGVDSSLIVALMKRQDVDIQTFSVGYGGAAEGFNELNYAKLVSEHVGTRHHELILGADSNIKLLPKMIHHYDEPHGEPTSMLVYMLCQFVRERVKVALSGTGGDELFYGYPRHAALRYLEWYRLLPAFVRRGVIERVVTGIPESTSGRHFAKRVRRFVSGSSLPPREAYLSWVKMIAPELQQSLLDDAIRSTAEDPSGDRFLRQCLLEESGRSLLDDVALIDVGGYLPEYQLAYMDRMSMATSLEVRSPLCDFMVTEYALSLPTDYRLRRTRSKHILKEVAKRYLPSQIVDRRKVGFDSPIGQWFKDELQEFVQGFLSKEQVARSGLLNPETVQVMVNDHVEGRRNYSLQLWSVMALEAWYRMFIEDATNDASEYELSDIRGSKVSA